MKSAIMTLFVAVCVSAVNATAIGQDVESPHQAKHAILNDMLVGNWSISGTTDGVEVTGVVEGRLAEGKESVLYSGYFQMKGNDAKVYLSGISGWDAATGKIKELLFSSDGSCATAWFEVNGNELIGKRNGIDRDGNKYTQDLKFIAGKGRWVGKPTSTLGEDGKVLGKHGEWVFTRK